jgi:hypothetical protein
MICIVFSKQEYYTNSFYIDFFSKPLFYISDHISHIYPTILIKDIVKYEQSLWNMLHMLAKCNKNYLFNFLHSMKTFYKCGGCRNDLEKYLISNPINMENSDSISWMKNYNLHVDNKTNKQTFEKNSFDYISKVYNYSLETEQYNLYVPI